MIASLSWAMANPLGLLATSVIIYLLLCQLLRFHHYRKHERMLLNQAQEPAREKNGGEKEECSHNRRPHPSLPLSRLELLGTMSLETAWGIVTSSSQYEFPAITSIALQFALFRTYGIPTISSLLNETGQLSMRKKASKRYADTEVLISEFLENKPGSERSIAAIARMNYIHSLYINAGKISNDDMLYTLSLFALEGSRWIERYGWRLLSDVEICAYGVFWKYIGECQGISFERLPSSHGESGWRNGVDFLIELKDWSEEYERTYMVPSESNRKTAEETIMILLWPYPSWIHPVVKSVLAVLMDDRLREAIMYPSPSRLATNLVGMAVSAHKFMGRHLTLPRLFPATRLSGEKVDAETNRITKSLYQSEPWYVAPTIRNRWLEQQAWMNRIRGRPLPGAVGYMGQGYEIENVGPSRFIGKGQKVMKGTKDELESRYQQQQFGIGCPFR